MLPPPPSGVPCYQGHRRCFGRARGDRDLFLACMATGCTWWHFLDFASLVAALEAKLLARPPFLLVATDGSEVDGVAAYAIALGDEAFSSGLRCEDQSAYRAETEAGFVAIQALDAAARRSGVTEVPIVLIMDCTAAMVTLQGGGSCKLLALQSASAASLVGPVF